MFKFIYNIFHKYSIRLDTGPFDIVSSHNSARMGTNVIIERTSELPYNILRHGIFVQHSDGHREYPIMITTSKEYTLWSFNMPSCDIKIVSYINRKYIN